MATLSKHQIIDYFEKGELILNPFKKINGEYDVEPASYDLRAGTFIWKEIDSKGEHFPKTKKYDASLPVEEQESVTLQPGQVMFVITYEEVKMPINMCGTVYAKNKFSRDGILALTTGHIDPGIQCPIVVRLINLRSIPYTFFLGQPIYTIVFHRIEVIEGRPLEAHAPITMERTYERTVESVNAALGNALNDISLTSQFSKKADFEELRKYCKELVDSKEFDRSLKSKMWDITWKTILAIFAIIGAIGAVVKIFEFSEK
ncbi:MAG: hypothetical protein EOO19_06975 [Chryseobacterium sp.]|nr:MAG: hypothetical protein EOO19_06975 [Chryseobacterium sp.]